ncbi:MAG TPA: potassium transporter TrkA [Desulfurococcales archaeon]|nr:potassium transporter TrkA [Desulfurococcales archaeon]
MIALVSLLLVILFSIIVVRIGTVALRMTGLPNEVAAFQAQSAFSGTGFTTSESEIVVSHPVRRKIIRILMLLGSAGITSAMATLVLTFVGRTPEEMAYRGFWLAIGLLALYLFARSKLIYKWMAKLIEKALERWTTIRVYDYEQLLGLSKGYTISQFKVKKDSWLAGKTLKELELEREGIIVLGIYRKVNGVERYIGAPKANTRIEVGDVIICYGREEAIINLSKRLKGVEGDLEHKYAIEREMLREAIRKLQGGFD